MRSVLLCVVTARFGVMVSRVRGVTVSGVSVVRRLLVVSSLMMLGSLTMMAGGMLVMFGGL